MAADPSSAAHGRPRVAVILAAGKGTRMRSARPKPLHRAGGRPLLGWVIEAARRAGCRRILVVIGHGGTAIREAFTGDDLVWVEQHEQRGTGHALAQAAPHVTERGTVLVLSGDVPLVTPATLDRLARAAEDAWGAMAVAELAQPGSLGRVLRADDGTLARIVEAADADGETLAVRRVNAGLYALPAPEVFADLARLRPTNARGELYLTDALGAAAADRRAIALVELDDPAEALGVNDRHELGRVHRRLLRRSCEALIDAGVTVLDPARTVVEPGVVVGADSELHPDVTLLGSTVVGAGCVIHQGVWARDTTIGDGVVVRPYSVLDQAQIGDRCQVGPFARLRPGAELERGARVGNFVEVKNARLGPDVRAGHLAYLGDATIGAGTNIGAGVVTCNYDGERKHRTTVGEGAFIGSDTMLVAPVEVGDGATTGAGSTITHDVPAEALAVGRARQRIVPGWRRRQRRRAEKDDGEGDGGTS